MITKQVAEVIKDLLTKHPHLRDDDNRLIATFWRREFGELNCKKKPTIEFLVTLASGSLTASESIHRARRKLQEEFPELRGTKYFKRHQAAEDVKHEIQNFNGLLK